MKETKNFKLSELYKFIKGSNKFNKSTINKNKGEYPVYSGQSIENGIIGYANTYAYDGMFVRIITVGDAGKTNIIKGKFSLAQNNGILKPINKDVTKDVDIEYLTTILSKFLPKLAKGQGKQKSLLKQDIDNFIIELPIKENGSFDIDTQKQLASRYKQLFEQQQILINNIEYLKNTNIKVEQYDKIIFKSITDIFDLSKSTNCSKFTIGFVNNNQGNIPVYGAVNNENYASYGYVKDNICIKENKNGKVVKTPIKYFENCLTYNIDGEGACGYVFYRTGRFSLSEKVRPLIIFDKYKDKLDPIYLKYVLHPLFLSKVRGRKINKTIIQDLQIPIPIKENGEFDLETQKEIAEKYRKLESIKERVINEIDKVLNITVEI